MRLDVATEEEARAQSIVIRKNTLDFQMATMVGDATHPDAGLWRFCCW